MDSPNTNRSNPICNRHKKPSPPKPVDHDAYLRAAMAAGLKLQFVLSNDDRVVGYLRRVEMFTLLVEGRWVGAEEAGDESRGTQPQPHLLYKNHIRMVTLA
jgi:hypothetical protein